jgi:hypothetical protein
VNVIAARVGEMFIEMGITIELFMCGFSPRALKNCLSKNVLTARIPGQGCGISPVLDTLPLVIRRLSLLGN